MARKGTSGEEEMVQHILEGAHKGGVTTQSRRTPEEKSRIGKKGGNVVRQAFANRKS